MFGLKCIRRVAIVGSLAGALFASAASAYPLPLFELFGQPASQSSERPVTAAPWEPRGLRRVCNKRVVTCAHLALPTSKIDLFDDVA